MKTKELKSSGNKSGQALIEFVLLFAIIASMMGLIYSGVKSTRDKMWKRMLCDVSAACPDCKSTESAKSAPGAGVNCKN